MPLDVSFQLWVGFSYFNKKRKIGKEKMGNRNGFEFWLLFSCKYYMIVLLYDLLNLFMFFFH